MTVRRQFLKPSSINAFRADIAAWVQSLIAGAAQSAKASKQAHLPDYSGGHRLEAGTTMKESAQC